MSRFTNSSLHWLLHLLHTKATYLSPPKPSIPIWVLATYGIQKNKNYPLPYYPTYDNAHDQQHQNHSLILHYLRHYSKSKTFLLFQILLIHTFCSISYNTTYNLLIFLLQHLAHFTSYQYLFYVNTFLCGFFQ